MGGCLETLNQINRRWKMEMLLTLFILAVLVFLLVTARIVFRTFLYSLIGVVSVHFFYSSLTPEQQELLLKLLKKLVGAFLSLF